MTFTPEDHPRSTDGKFAPKSGADAGFDLDNPYHRPNLVPMSDEAMSVLEACREAGGTPLIVGGAVRDALEGTPSHDIDIEVHGVESLTSLIPHLYKVGEVMLTGRAFGVLKVVHDDTREVIDVAVPRRESKSGSGHRGFDVVVDPSLSMEDALARRDFTINAIAWNPETGQVIDPHGGLADLQDRVLRHTSDAFAEDPLRVLRGAQFAARFGMTMHPDTVELSRSIAPTFNELPVERVYWEIRKLALSPQPSAGMYVLQDTGWVDNLPELAGTIGLEQDPQYHPEKDVFEHQAQAADVASRLARENGLDDDSTEVVVLAAMMHDLGKQVDSRVENGRIVSGGHESSGPPLAESLLKRLGYPEKTIERVTPIVREHMMLHSTVGTPSASALRRLRRRLDKATVQEWAIVCAADVTGRSGASTQEEKHADHLAAPRPEVWEAYQKAEDVKRTDAEKKVGTLVNGRLLMELGMKPGPEFRSIIAAGADAQDDEEFDNVESARAWVKNRFL